MFPGGPADAERRAGQEFRGTPNYSIARGGSIQGRGSSTGRPAPPVAPSAEWPVACTPGKEESASPEFECQRGGQMVFGCMWHHYPGAIKFSIDGLR